MTSIYDIPREDIEIFLLANNKDIEGNDEDYELALSLLKDKKAKGHTTSIIEWMIAHNLLINKVDIPTYSTYDIDNISQTEINQLAKLLKMKGNNRQNIKNILQYLNKLDFEITLLPELQDVILDTLTQLELRSIDIIRLNPDDIINLLQFHRNKKEIRKFIHNNMRKILFYNFLDIDVERLNDLVYIIYNQKFNDYIRYKLIQDNKRKLVERYGSEELNRIENIVNSLPFKDDVSPVEIGSSNMDALLNFIIKLVEIDEIGLAKMAIFLVNKYKFERGFPFNYHLVEKAVYEINDIDVLRKLINNIEEDVFLEELGKTISYDMIRETHISVFLTKLVILQRYDLLIKTVQILLDKDFTGNDKVINKILQGIKRAIQSKSDNLIIRYINIINTMSILNTIKSGNRNTNARHLAKFEKLIKEAEEGK